MSWENRVFFIILMVVGWAWLFFMGVLMKKYDFGWGDTPFKRFRDAYLFFGAGSKDTPENRKKAQKAVGNFFMIFSSCIFIVALMILIFK